MEEEVRKYRRMLEDIPYPVWQRLSALIEQEFGVKMSECKRQLALGQSDKTTEDLLRFG